jgi:CelD/BcsL family acetyltransferase involved in cellulose biosynthesis
MRASRLGIRPPLPLRLYLRRPVPRLPFPLQEPGHRLFRPGGHALDHGVRSLGLRVGDEVLVPAWPGGREVETLLVAGIVPRFYEGRPNLEPDADELEALLGPRVRALYLIHHLGFPQDAPGWLSWCRTHGLLLLEDAAQGWLGSIGDRPLGSFGDLAIFCPSSTVGLPATGALVSSRPPDAPVGAPATGLAGLGRRQVAWLLPRVLAGDPTARRRVNYRMLLADLGDQVAEPFARLPEGASPFVFPVEADGRTRLLARLEEQGIHPLDMGSFPRPPLPADRFPLATRRRVRLVGLPVHQALGGRDLERIAAAVRGRPPAPASTVELLASLEPLREPWTRLAERSRSIFKTWEWASVWWHHQGGGRRLEVAAVRRGNVLVGIVPMYRWRRRPLDVLRFLGHGPGDELGPVCDAEDRAVVARGLRRALARLDWDVLVGEQLPREQDWGVMLAGRRLTAESSPVLRFGRAGWDGFLRSRSANFREQVGRHPRRLARDRRVRYRLADGSRDLRGELDTLFALHAARWSHRPSNFLAHAPFHRAFARVALERGWLRLWFLEVDGEAVAALYGFRFAGTECYYQAGRDPRWNRYRVGFVLLAHAVRQAADDGVAEYRLLRGGEEYKQRFASADPGLETIGLAHSRLAGAALPALAAMRATPGPLGRLARRVGAGYLNPEDARR